MPFATLERNHTTVYQDLVIQQGTTWSITVTLKNDAATAPFDLTNYLIRSSLRKTLTSDPTTILGTVTDASEGVFTLALTSVETAALEAPARYFYDVEVYDAGSPPVVYRVLEGRIEISAEVTR